MQGILPDCLVTVVGTQWYGSEALELTYATPTGRVANELLYRHEEPHIEVVVSDICRTATSTVRMFTGAEIDHPNVPFEGATFRGVHRAPIASPGELTGFGPGSRPSMRFSEAGSPWQHVPPWASYLIQCGFVWADGRAKRRIGIISMPCESAGAGLVALGAIRYRLTLPEANDALSHFDRIERLAARGDGETSLRHQSMRGRFRLEGRDPRGLVWVRQEQRTPADRFNSSGPPRVAIHAGNANEWRLEREGPTETVLGSALLHRRFYEGLIDGAAPPLDINLARSDSAICLAGRVAGESVSRGSFSAIRLECHDRVADLTELLTVHSWSPETVSRITFFNSRTRQLDRDTGFTSLVVADGDAAFLRVLDAPGFKESDVIGVIHRGIERDRLESIGTKLADLSQWYVADAETLDRVSTPPPGITLSVLQRRQA